MEVHTNYQRHRLVLLLRSQTYIHADLVALRYLLTCTGRCHDDGAGRVLVGIGLGLHPLQVLAVEVAEHLGGVASRIVLQHHRLLAGADLDADGGLFLYRQARVGVLVIDFPLLIHAAGAFLLHHDIELAGVLGLDALVALAQQVRHGGVLHLLKRLIDHKQHADKSAGRQQEGKCDARHHRDDRQRLSLVDILVSGGFAFGSMFLFFHRSWLPARHFLLLTLMAQLVLDVHLRGLFIFIRKNNGWVFLKFVDVVQHLRRRLVALVRVLLHGAHHNLLQPLRDVGIDRARQGRLALNLLDRHRYQRVRLKGQLAGEHLEHHDADRIDVAARVGKGAAGLLGTDVVHRADGLVGDGLGGAAGKAGNAKIGDLDRPVREQHDVLGLDVPVDDALVVRMLQRPQNLNGEVQRLLPAQHMLLFDIIL